MYCQHYKECMAEGYKAMADERRMMDRGELVNTLYKLWHEKDKDTAVILMNGILAGFDRLTEVADLAAKYKVMWRNAKEALERICKAYPCDGSMPHLNCGCSVCWQVKKYLDSQQKPIEYDWMCKPRKPKDEEVLDDGFGMQCSPYCPDCGRKSMSIVRPGKVQCDLCCDDELILRDILREHYQDWTPPEALQGAIDSILKHFQLKEGE